ncbi:hypothetical protein N6L24_06165 [Cognatishimia sp. SS12]|uniref:hypothetical protein n=1 Tax=Cognatishimia sp. SS12 TaxID=2979465 RepID=UPI00232FCB3B|nr:hypothetical protein [Cognatishimia sp. SS12]MDC0737854.1 hypothetical protein [Cognatishimia sp. SS12]
MTSTADVSQPKKTKAEATKEQAVQMAERAKDHASETVKQAQEQLDAGLKYGASELERLSKDGQEFVRKNPGVAIAGAVGVGLLMGLAMRRRF